MKSQIRPRFEKIVLTNAQILALPTTSVILVSGAVAGLNAFLVPIWATMNFFNAGNVTGIDDPGSALQINAGGSLSLASFEEDTANGMNDVTGLLAAGAGPVQATLSIQQATSKPVPGGLRPNLDTPGGTPPVNVPIQIMAVNSGNFTGGNALNTLTVWLYYHIVNV